MSRNYKTGLIITGDASGGIRAIKATDDELGKLNQGFDRGTRRSKQFTQNINGTSRELQMLRRAAAPIAGAIAGMFAANSLQNQINWGDQLQKTNLRIGASTEALSQYNYVASLSGVEFNQLTTAWQRQTRRIAEAAAGTGVAVEALDRLNLSAQELNQLAPEDQFERIAEAMQGVENSSERVRLAQQLWDSEGVKLVQIVNQGTDAMAAMRAEADALGLTISQDTANAMASYNDEVDRLKFAAQGVSQTLLSELVPAMTAGLQNVNAFIQEVGGAEVVVGHLTDGAQVLAALLAGRYAGAFATATAAKLAATQQSIAYQMALARMAGVSATAAGAQASLAAATRGAGAAMALVGGPLGAAMIAGGAIYYFREELGLVAPKVQTATERVDDMTSALDANSEAALKNARAMLEAEQQFQRFRQVQLVMEVNRQRQIVADEQRQWDAVGGQQAFGMGQASESQQALRDLQVQLMDTRNAIEAAGGSVAEIDSKLEALERTTRDVITPTTDLGDTTNTTAAAAREAAKQTTTLANSYENLLDRIQPNRRAARQYAQDVGTLNLALATGRINAVQYMQAMGMLQESFQAAQRETDELANKTVDAVFDMEGAWDEVRLNGLRRLDDGIANMWQNAIDGSLDAGEAMKRIFNQTLAEMAHMAITRPIMVQIAGSMGMGGSGAGSTGMGGFDLSPSGISNAWNMVQNGFGGNSIGAGVTSLSRSAYGSLTGNAVSYGGTGWASSATAGNASWLNNPSQVSNISMGLQSIGGSYVGNELGSSLFGRQANSNIGATVGAIAGSFLPIPGGTFIGSTLGGLADSLFGSGKKTFDFDFLQGQHSYVFGDRTSAFGDSGLTALSDYKLGEQQDQLNEMLTAMAEFDNRIAATAIPERFDAMKEAIDGFTHSGPEDLFETRLREMITGGEVWAAEAVASITDPEKLAQGMLGALQLEQVGVRLGSELSAEIQAAISGARGDGAADVVNSVMAQAQAAELLVNSVERLHLQFDATAQGALAAAGSLSDYVGGLDNLAAVNQAYYNAAFSESERLSYAQQDLLASLSSVTDEVPRTVEELRTLVEAQDLNTEAGGQLAYQLMQLAPAMRETNAAVRQAIEQQYQDVLGRAPDAAGLEYWFDQVATGSATLEQALSAIAASSEAASYAIEQQYQESLGRAPDTSGMDYWFDRVASGAITLEDALWNIANSAEAASVAAIGGADAMRERTQLELQLLRVQGNANALRDYELSQLAESNRPLQERIWAIEDERAAMQEAERAQQERIRAIEQEARAMMSAGGNIRQFVESLQNTAGAGLSPETAYQNAEESFLAAISTIYTSDDSALVQDTINGITGIAQQYLSAAEAYGASGNIYQQAQALVEGSLDDLAGRLGSEELEDIDPQLQAMVDQLKNVATNTGLSGPLAKQVPLAQTFAEFFGGSGSQNYMVRQIGALSEIEKAIRNLEFSSGGGSDIDTSPSQPTGKTLTRSQVTSLVDASDNFSFLKQTMRGDSSQRAFSRSLAGDFNSGSLAPSVARNNVDKLISAVGFDEANYLRLNPDIAEAIGRGEIYSGFQHFLLHGIDEGRKFAKGGVFTNSIVSSPTLFDMGLMGESGDEAIMPLARHRNGSLGVRAELPPMPQFPALGQNDVLQVLQDVRRELVETRKQNQRLQEENNQHLAAANNQRGAAATQQIAATKEGNKMLKKLQDDSRLEAAKR